MDKVRLFLKVVVGEEEIENYIENDRWVEFPTRALGAILEKYEVAQLGALKTAWENILSNSEYLPNNRNAAAPKKNG